MKHLAFFTITMFTTIASCLATALAPTLLAAPTRHTNAESLANRLAREAAVIRPNAAESMWQQIPWISSAVEAQHLAEEEKRPIFLWMLDENPLERC